MVVAIKVVLLLPLIRLMSARRVTDGTGLVACTFNGPGGHSVVIPQANCTMCRALLSGNFLSVQLPKSFRASSSSFVGDECSCDAKIVGGTFALPSVFDYFCDDKVCDSKCCFKLYGKLHDVGKPLEKRISACTSWELDCPATPCGDTVEECGGWSGLLGLDDGYFRGGSKLNYVLHLAHLGDQEAKEIGPVLKSRWYDMEQNTENEVVKSMCKQLDLPEPCSAKDLDRARRCDSLGLPFTCSDLDIGVAV